MEKLFNFINTNVGSAIGWTLVHSVWQIFAISLIYAILLRIKKQSEFRYWSGISLMFLQLITSLITFFVFFQSNVSSNQSSPSKQYFSKFILQITSDNQVSVFQQILFYIENNLNNFVVFWMVGMLFLIIRLLFNLFYVNQLKTSGISEVDKKVLFTFELILEKVQFNRAVQIYQSSKVSLPVVIGFLKPIILLPIGLVANLSQKQIEAILAHEIAHIKRNDFIINLLQSILEIVFFFHPAFWWITGKIREERENCCDDLAIELIGEKIHLVKALANVESFRQNPILAMAFGKKRFTLLERVQRILGMEANPNKTQESLFFVTVLAGIIAGYFVFQSNRVSAQSHAPKPPKAPKIDESLPKLVIHGVIIQNDSLSKNKGVMQFFNGKTSVFVTREGEIFINNKKQMLSEEERMKAKKHIDELVRLENKMKPYEQEMEKLSQEMDKYSEKMNAPSAQMEALSRNMDLQATKMSEFASKQEKLVKQMARLQEDSKQYKDLAKQLEESEKQMQLLEKEMSVYDKEMEKFDSEMEKYHAPMDSLGNLMSRFEKPMEEIGREMEVHSKAIIQLLPYQIRKDIQNGMSFTPPPPPPPLPAKHSKVSKPASVSKTLPPPPPPPPASRNKVSKPSKVSAQNPPDKINE